MKKHLFPRSLLLFIFLLPGVWGAEEATPEHMAGEPFVYEGKTQFLGVIESDGPQPQTLSARKEVHLANFSGRTVKVKIAGLGDITMKSGEMQVVHGYFDSIDLTVYATGKRYNLSPGGHHFFIRRSTGDLLLDQDSKWFSARSVNLTFRLWNVTGRTLRYSMGGKPTQSIRDEIESEWTWRTDNWKPHLRMVNSGKVYRPPSGSHKFWWDSSEGAAKLDYHGG